MTPIFSAPRFFLLDDALAPEGQFVSRLYTDWQHTDTIPARHLSTLDTALRQGWEKGWQAVLLLPYEMGAILMDTPVSPEAPTDLLCFWFSSCTFMDRTEVAHWLQQKSSTEPEAPAGFIHLHATISPAAFNNALAHIQQCIREGETYQVNYTHRWHAETFGEPLSLYQHLRQAQPVPFGALAQFGDDRWILSFSPELFIRHDGRGTLTTEPMKGTAPVEQYPSPSASEENLQPANHALQLSTDPKNQAENLMIVDLLRNDLGQIAQTGSIKVPHLFRTQQFGAVWQMTSTITGQLPPTTSLSAILAALFPCGSITGAPKKKTMEIIHAVESGTRGLYTGAIGWVDPPPTEHKTGAFCFSVAIRTLILEALQKNQLRQARIGIGSGITLDSQAEAEYAECGWKARFIRQHDPGFSLLETIRVQNTGPERLAWHLERLQNSADTFGFTLNREEIATAILKTCQTLPPSKPARLRLSLTKCGKFELTLTPLPLQTQEPVTLFLSKTNLPVHDPVRRHKTTFRPIYDQGWQQAEQQGGFDTLFFNTNQHLLEGGRSSIFIKTGGRWLTPPLTLDILPGIMRRHVLENAHTLLHAPAEEALITHAMLDNAQEIRVANALRGLLSAVIAPCSRSSAGNCF